MSDLKPFLVRLTPDTVQALDKLKKELGIPKALIINNAVLKYAENDTDH